jgi:DNA-binding NtrC family response regulator
MKHPWPGNVRELRNALERAAILCEGGLITPAHLSLHAETIATSFDAATDLRSAERRAIDKALRETDGNKAKAARRLGLSRTQLYGRLRKYQIPEAARCGATPERVNCLRRSGDLHLDSENWVDASSNDS